MIKRYPLNSTVANRRFERYICWCLDYYLDVWAPFLCTVCFAASSPVSATARVPPRCSSLQTCCSVLITKPVFLGVGVWVCRQADAGFSPTHTRTPLALFVTKVAHSQDFTEPVYSAPSIRTDSLGLAFSHDVVFHVSLKTLRPERPFV